eukprot:gene32318-41879_t
MGGPPIKELIENIKWAEIVLAPSLDVVAAASSTSTQIFAKWLSFFNDLQIPPPVAERYSKLITDVEVGMKIKRLSVDKIFVNYPSISLLMGLLNIKEKKFVDDNGTISVQSFISMLSHKTDVFLAYDWSMNEKHYQLVAKVNALLKVRGFTTWFDDDKLEGDMKHKISKGIDNCRVVLHFITDSYVNRIAKQSLLNNCFVGFNHANHRKKIQISVVIEKEMRDIGSWEGPLGMVLGALPFVDLSTKSTFDTKIDELVNTVMSHLHSPPLNELMANINWAELIISSSVTTAISKSATTATTVTTESIKANTNNIPTTSTKLLFDFFKDMRIVPHVAERYARVLFNAGVETTDQLRQNLEKNQQLLQEHNFDEDDVEDIWKALLLPPPIIKAISPAPAPLLPSSSTPVILSGHKGAINCLIELQDGRICSASSDRTVRVWNLQGRADSCERIFSSHTQMKNGLIRSAGQDKNIIIWSISGISNQPYAILGGHKDSIITLIAMRDGRLLSFLEDNTYLVWNLRERKCEKVYKAEHTDVMRHAIMLFDGKTICTASSDRTIRIMGIGGSADETLLPLLPPLTTRSSNSSRRQRILSA